MKDYNTNWKTSMMGHMNMGDTGPGDDDKNYQPPKNYRPSTVQERENWNKFLDYLSEKGVGGNEVLDKRDQKLGLKYLEEYNKKNPEAQVSENFIPTVQYESYLIRKKGSFPGLTANQNKYAFENLSPAYRNRPISPLDSWLGSYTSKQYYPVYERHTKEGAQKFGTDFQKYLSGLSETDLAKIMSGVQN